MKRTFHLAAYMLAAVVLTALVSVTALAEGDAVEPAAINRGTVAETLVLGGAGGGEAYINAGDIGTLVIGDGAPEAVRVCGGVENIEISGSGHTVTVSGRVSGVTVSGEGNGLRVPWGGRVDGLRMDGEARDCSAFISAAPVETVELRGEGNRITLNCDAGEAVLGGVDCELLGQGSVDVLTLQTYRSSCGLAAASTVDELPTGLGDLDIDLRTSETIDAGEHVAASALITNPFDIDCQVKWYVNNKLVESRDITAGPSGTELSLDHEIVYDSATTSDASVLVVAEAKNASGRKETASKRVDFTIEKLNSVLGGMSIQLSDAGCARGEVHVAAKLRDPIPVTCLAVWYLDGQAVRSHTVTVGPEGTDLALDAELEKIPSSGMACVTLKLTQGRMSATRVLNVKVGVTPEEALATVTHQYAGDRTLEWALAHDYDDNMKTAFVNAKGYESATDTLVWVNLTYQRVNVFKGSKGNWTLEKTFLCGTGAPGSGTPVGEYTVWYTQPNGWNHGSYIVRPVVRFNVGSGYAFHSRLWDPTHTRLIDARIGFPISAGCVRMYDEDAQWMLDNVVPDTKVVIH